MSSNDMMRKARLAALRAQAEKAKQTEPEVDDSLVSEGTKENVKAAGRLAAKGSRWATKKAVEVADRAAEKTRQAKEAAEQKRAAAKDAARLAAEAAEREAQARAEREAAEVAHRKEQEAAAEAARQAEREAAEAQEREQEERAADEARPASSDEAEPGVAEPDAENTNHSEGYDLTINAPMSASLAYTESTPDSEGDEARPTPSEDPNHGLLVTDGVTPAAPEEGAGLVKEVPTEEAPLEGVTAKDIEQALGKDAVEPQGKDARFSPSIPRSWLIAGGSLVLLGAIGAGAFYFLGGQDDATPEVAVVAHPEEALAPVEIAAPSEDEVAEPAQEDLVVADETSEEVTEEAPESIAEAEGEAPVEAEPVAEAETQEPEATPVVEAPKPTPSPVAKAPVPRPAPARAPAPQPAPAPKKEEPKWQDEAMDAMDAWAKELDL